VLGALFRSHSVSTAHDELLIFITPRIVRGT
jgi:type II secretory pathway component HofQ